MIYLYYEKGNLPKGSDILGPPVNAFKLAATLALKCMIAGVSPLLP